MAFAAPYAALVMDARDGRVIHSENADTRLHPASLTKMMTLYLVFDAVQRGQLSLDQKITISANAAAEPPSKLGLRRGQQIELQYLIRAAAVKSANDAATALGEAVSGSEEAFARKMTATARAMGMKNTTFKNAHGLTAAGHLSTARDMALLGRQLFYDFPQYYNLFSRRSTSAKIATVYNTNRRFLDAYQGADGIKTGYTRAAGFNLVASAQRGGKRVIVSLFGGNSTASRNAKVAELMDLGLRQAPTQVAVVRPARVNVASGGATVIARADTTLKTAPRPVVRAREDQQPVAVAAVDTLAVQIATEVSRALTDEELPQIAASSKELADAPPTPDAQPLLPNAIRPLLRPDSIDIARRSPDEKPEAPEVEVASIAPPPPAPEVRSVRQGNAGTYIVQLGGKHNRTNAERLLLTTALQEMEALEGSKRDLLPTGEPGWYRARFVGLSAEAAETACARLAARQTPCEVVAGG
ncbi:D-alanyl-D-alanine carboxypeptidase family protein [Halovulum dunhuangense]|nr:D-alanyl-D-alanine carboxypeptidase family protein [Halovulum dunhuangense]